MTRLHLLHPNQFMAALTSVELLIQICSVCSLLLPWHAVVAGCISSQLFDFFFYGIAYFVILFYTLVSRKVDHNVSRILKLSTVIEYYSIRYILMDIRMKIGSVAAEYLISWQKLLLVLV